MNDEIGEDCPIEEHCPIAVPLYGTITSDTPTAEVVMPGQVILAEIVPRPRVKTPLQERRKAAAKNAELAKRAGIHRKARKGSPRRCGCCNKIALSHKGAYSIRYNEHAHPSIGFIPKCLDRKKPDGKSSRCLKCNCIHVKCLDGNMFDIQVNKANRQLTLKVPNTLSSECQITEDLDNGDEIFEWFCQIAN
jgi:hypothetical protein